MRREKKLRVQLRVTWPALLSIERSVWVRLCVFSATPSRGMLTARERFLSWKALTENPELSTCYIVSWSASFSVRWKLSFIRTLILDGRESRLLSDALLSAREHHLKYDGRNITLQIESRERVSGTEYFRLCFSGLKIFYFQTWILFSELPGWSCQ